MNIIHRLLALKFAVTLGAFDTMFCIIMLSACQQARIKQRVDYEPGPSRAESRIRDRTRGTLPSGGFHRSAEKLYRYPVEKPTKKPNLVPLCLRREFVIAFGTFKAVFRIVVLGEG